MHQIMAMMEARKLLGEATCLIDRAMREVYPPDEHYSVTRRPGQTLIDETHTLLSHRIGQYLNYHVDNNGLTMPLGPHVDGKHGESLRVAWEGLLDARRAEDAVYRLGQHPIDILRRCVGPCLSDADAIYLQWRQADFAEFAGGMRP